MDADRMVRKVAEAIYGAAYGRASVRKSRLAIVATLRLLAEWPGDVTESELLALADEIEATP